MQGRVSSKAVAEIRELGFECLSHTPYSPDLAPSDYWLFGEMERPLRGKDFQKIYAQELAAVSGYEGVELSEIAINLPQFPVIKSSLYRGRMTKYPSLPQTIQDITFVGDWTRTIQGEDMLLADSGDNHPERIIIFSTKKNLEILCNSDCIYLDGTFKSCPDLFYQLITLHAFVERK